MVMIFLGWVIFGLKDVMVMGFDIVRMVREVMLLFGVFSWIFFFIVFFGIVSVMRLDV